MCWMSIRTDAEPTTGVVEDVRRHEGTNGHSWGVAVAHDGHIGIYKGLGAMPSGVLTDLPTDGVDAALGHTRFATKGDITVENAHPFPIRDESGDVVAALAHNGTWHDAPRPVTSDRCDSYYIAQELQKRYRACKTADADFEKLVKMVGDYVGETITVLHRDGRAFAYAGRFDITKGESPATADDSPWYRSRSAEAARARTRSWTRGFEPGESIRGHTPTETTGRRAGRDWPSAEEYAAAKDDYATDGGDDDEGDDEYTVVRSSGGESMRQREVLQI